MVRESPPLLQISWKCSCPLAKEPRQITAIAGCSLGRCLWRGLEAPERHLLGSECGFFPSLETLGSHSVLCGDDPAALPSAHPILAPLGLGTGTAERGEGMAPPALRKCSEEGVSLACNLVQFGRFTWGYVEVPISIRLCNPLPRLGPPASTSAVPFLSGLGVPRGWRGLGVGFDL